MLPCEYRGGEYESLDYSTLKRVGNEINNISDGAELEFFVWCVGRTYKLLSSRVKIEMKLVL